MDNFKRLLNSISNVDIEIEKDKDIEFELSQFTSLIYDFNDDTFYVWTLDLDDEEEYTILVDLNRKENIKGYDYEVTIKDIDDFVEFVNNIKNGE